MNEMKEAALSLARKYISVFPAMPGGKTPATEHGFRDATLNLKKIEMWFDSNPYNLAIPTGTPPYYFVVIDLDYKPEKGIDGRETVRDWEMKHGKKLPATWTVTTGGGGTHLYYRGNGTENNRVDLYPGVDIRAKGGYVLAPPSIHQSGNCYEWDLSPDEIALAPVDDTVREFLLGEEREKKGLYVPDRIEQGCRNQVLFSAACSMQSKGFPDSAIMAAIRELNSECCVPPVSDREIKAITASATKFEKGGQMERWKKSAELTRQEILQELKKQLKY